MKNIFKYIIILIIFMMFSLINLSTFSNYQEKQILWYVVGFILFFIIRRINNKKIIKIIFPIYIVLNILLLYLLLFGEAINNSRAWINIGFCSFQPSEFMKITLIILLSSVATSNNKYVLKCFVLTLIPGILTFLEPDTGNVIFYIVILLATILADKNNLKKLYIPSLIISLFFIIFVFLYLFNRNIFGEIFGTSFYYRIDRVLALFNNSSYQLNTALMNIGASGLTGNSYLSSIPEAKTDFAFALLVSKNGFIGATIYLITNMCFNNLLINSNRFNNGVMKYIVNSFIIMKIVQESIHILMNIGLFPITGITLPFISYGGTSLLTYFIMLAIISKDGNMGMDMD